MPSSELRRGILFLRRVNSVNIRTAIPTVFVARKRICLREAAAIIKSAEIRKSKITVEVDGKQNVGTTDSIMSLLSLEIVPDDHCILRATGVEPEKAINDVIQILKVVEL